MDAVSVFCRIRPPKDGDDDKVVLAAGSKTVTLNHGCEQCNFTFDRVFDFYSTQMDIFEGVKVAESVQDVLGGYNATIFAYGQTASGKTHTMEGADVFDPIKRGIVPRSAEALFRACSEAPSQIEFAIKVSFVEIYMERIRDLLDVFGQKRTNLQIRQDPNLGVHVAGCTESFVTNEEELLRCLTSGHKSRATAATGMNEGSSRSHSVLSITVMQRNIETETKRVGKLVLVDLAGSEMVRKTHAAGQQLEEAKVINKSLSALGQVIYALTDEKKAHIPYRNSKLTRMLQDSLGGNAKTALIVAVSGSTENYSETLSTMKFGQRAKAVKNKPKINERKSFEELTALLNKAEAAIDMQSTYITALELRVPAKGDKSKVFDTAGCRYNDAGPTATILDLQQKISTLNEELSEERAESRRCSKEVLDLTTLLHEKERLLLEAGELMIKVETKMGDTVRDQSDLISKNEILQKANRQIQQKAQFRITELELRLERVGAGDARLRKEAADTAVVSQCVSEDTASGITTPHCFSSTGASPKAPSLSLSIEDPKSLAVYVSDQRPALVADLRLKCDTIDRLEREMNRSFVERKSINEQQHMRSLQQRLEQLVAVHRQLLRKYAALELNLGEANKMIALRDERISQLEQQCEQRLGTVTAECHHLSKLMKDLNLKLLSKKSFVFENVSAGPRTLRGGQNEDSNTSSISTPMRVLAWWN